MSSDVGSDASKSNDLIEVKNSNPVNAAELKASKIQVFGFRRCLRFFFVGHQWS
jgi:hypothetical protein